MMLLINMGIEVMTTMMPMMAWSKAFPSFQPAKPPKMRPKSRRIMVMKAQATRVFRAPCIIKLRRSFPQRSVPRGYSAEGASGGLTKDSLSLS